MTLAGRSIAFVQPHIGAREFAHCPRTFVRRDPAVTGDESSA